MQTQPTTTPESRPPSRGRGRPPGSNRKPRHGSGTFASKAEVVAATSRLPPPIKFIVKKNSASKIRIVKKPIVISKNVPTQQEARAAINNLSGVARQRAAQTKKQLHSLREAHQALVSKHTRLEKAFQSKKEQLKTAMSEHALTTQVFVDQVTVLEEALRQKTKTTHKKQRWKNCSKI